MAAPRMTDVIKDFGDFLRQLEFQNKSGVGLATETFMVFTHEDFTVILHGQDAETLGAIVNALYEAVEAQRPIAKDTVSSLAADCVIAIARIAPSRGSPSFETGVAAALRELRIRLSAPDELWKFVLPVGGLAPSGLPMTVGQVQFANCDDQRALGDLREQAESVLSLRSEHEGVINSAKQSFDEGLRHFQRCALAIVNASGIDEGTARLVAQKTLRSTLDSINFYADRKRWGMWAYLYGDTSDVNEPFIAFRISKEQGRSDSFKTGGRNVGPIRSLPLSQLGPLRGFSRISEMLARQKLEPAQERLLTAIQWAGRAQADARTEEAFLLYAISLESLILGSQSSGELGYRLALRVAHLVAPPE